MEQKAKQKKNILCELQKMTSGLFVIFMLFFFPLFYQNKYFNIKEAKLKFFNICSIGLVILTVIFVCAGWLEKRRTEGWKKRPEQEKWNIKEMLSKMQTTSWFAVIFFLAVILSTVFSVYPEESFYGRNGRMLGAIVFLLCIFVYGILGKYLKPGIWMAWIFLISNTVVVMISVLQFWGLDFLGMSENVVDITSFVSTIGNKNAYAGYLCMILPIGMVLYYLSEMPFSKIIYGLFLVLGFYGAFVTTADSWILGVGISFVVMLWFSLTDNHNMKHFLELCILFGISSLILKISIVVGQAENIKTDFSYVFQTLKLQNFMINGYVLLAEAILFTGGMWLIKAAEKGNIVPPYQKIKKWLFTLLAVIAGIGILLFLIANFLENKQWDGVFGWMNYLKLQDNFGNGRGIMWKHTVKGWIELEPWRKFLGYGVNCFDQFYYQSGEVVETIKTIDPHNEILLFLSIMGIFGTIGYFGLLISTIVSAAKMSYQYPVMMMGAVMLCSYLAQAMVNNPTVFITPNLFLFLGILKSIERNYKEIKI